MKQRIDVGSVAEPGRFVARSVGTKFALSTAENVTEIDLYDEISPWGVSARDFRARLRDASGRISLRINSPGGIVTEGIAIYNDLVDYKHGVDVKVTGVAASMASIIAMAGDRITIAENAFFMIHNPWGMTIGDKNEHAATVDVLDRMGEAMARTYVRRSKTGIRAVKEMMDNETWLSGKEAVEAGFADALETAADARAKFDLSVFKNAPAALAVAASVFEATETESDVEKLLMRDAGWTRSQARAFIRDVKAGKTSTEATPGAGNEVRLDTLIAAVRSASASLPQFHT